MISDAINVFSLHKKIVWLQYMKRAAIIVDLDGTIAHRASDRQVYDWGRVDEDAYDPVIGEIAQMYRSDHDILVVTARSEEAREGSVRFLNSNGFEFDALYMRPHGDYRNDAEFKVDAYQRHIEPHYTVRFVLEDRDHVVRAWRRLGLRCLQVAEGNF
jgi:hypothetical protein